MSQVNGGDRGGVAPVQPISEPRNEAVKLAFQAMFPAAVGLLTYALTSSFGRTAAAVGASAIAMHGLRLQLNDLQMAEKGRAKMAASPAVDARNAVEQLAKPIVQVPMPTGTVFTTSRDGAPVAIVPVQSSFVIQTAYAKLTPDGQVVGAVNIVGDGWNYVCAFINRKQWQLDTQALATGVERAGSQALGATAPGRADCVMAFSAGCRTTQVLPPNSVVTGMQLVNHTNPYFLPASHVVQKYLYPLGLMMAVGGSDLSVVAACLCAVRKPSTATSGWSLSSTGKDLKSPLPGVADFVGAAVMGLTPAALQSLFAVSGVYWWLLMLANGIAIFAASSGDARRYVAEQPAIRQITDVVGEVIRRSVGSLTSKPAESATPVIEGSLASGAPLALFYGLRHPSLQQGKVKEFFRGGGNGSELVILGAGKRVAEMMPVGGRWLSQVVLGAVGDSVNNLAMNMARSSVLRTCELLALVTMGFGWQCLFLMNLAFGSIGSSNTETDLTRQLERFVWQVAALWLLGPWAAILAGLLCDATTVTRDLAVQGRLIQDQEMINTFVQENPGVEVQFEGTAPSQRPRTVILGIAAPAGLRAVKHYVNRWTGGDKKPEQNAEGSPNQQ